MKSTIFTEAEHKSLRDRLKGSKSDKNGIFSARVKPKIKELLEHWFPKCDKLTGLIKKKEIKQGKNNG